MTQAVAHILSEFEQLSDTERKELRRVIVERVPTSDDLTDDDFAALAAESFAGWTRRRTLGVPECGEIGQVALTTTLWQ